MKKFPHQQFIEDNAIEIKSLPKMLQKRIHGFEELENDLQHTTEHDRTQLFDKLERLSHEIMEDLEEEFEELLENNDVEDETVLAKENETALVKDKGKESPSPTLTQTEMVHKSANEAVAVNEDETSTNDEAILKKMYTDKQLKVLPAQLIRKGFQTRLDKKIIVGKYALHRGKYDIYYRLLLTEK